MTNELKLNDYAEHNAAMAEFQLNYAAPRKDRKVDFVTKSGQRIKYDYADLENIQTAIREAAAPAGLSWNVAFDSQVVKVQAYGKEQDHLMVTATVAINHSSGTTKTYSGIPLFTNKFTDPQSVGSIKTYAERYTLTSAFGIASGEDDEQTLTNDRLNNNTNSNATNNGPSKQELEQELQQELQEHKNYLMDSGIDIGAMNKFIIDKENVDNITQVEPVKQLGYFKAQAQKIKTNKLRDEKQEKDNAEQQSLMDGNTTTAINWGSAE